jgi:hypothetical protein
MQAKNRIVHPGLLARVVIMTGLLAVALTGLFSRPSAAGLFTLVDDNSVVEFDTDTYLGAYSWTVDGVSHLQQQWFWYRVGDTFEQSIDSLSIQGEQATDTNLDGDLDTLFVAYDGDDFLLEIRFSLDGGAPGSDASDLGEQITITATGDGSLDFHFFQYTNFDLEGTPGGDTAVFTNVNTVQQSEGSFQLTEAVITPFANHREIDVYSNTLDELNDFAPTTLSDTPAIGTPFGPDDVTWAFQWDFFIPPSGSVQISKDKNMSAIPEPASWILFGMGAALFAAARLRRRGA